MIKILISESQYINLITEASKIDVLVNKLGLTQDRANEIYELAGPLSVWLTNKLINAASVGEFESLVASLPQEEEKKIVNLYKTDKKYRDSFGISAINKKFGMYRNVLVSIMDWIRVGLNGNVKPYQDLSYEKLYAESKKWHDSLNLGEGDINYVEKNEIIRDYRKDGIGFYWVNLNTTKSDEECDRMGHCGRTGKGDTLYSLREVIKFGDKYTLNRSHITAAIGEGIIYQMKGQKNSKPLEKYYSYIIDLLLNDKSIKGFGSEYESIHDFTILDLSKDDVKKIYEKRPELFNDRKSRKALKSVGIEIEPTENKDILEIELEPEDVHYYLGDDWVFRKPKNQYGQTGREIYFSEIVIKGEDIWDLYENYGEWDSALEYYTDEDNQKFIWDLIKKYAEKRDTDLNGMSLKDAIEELDEDHEIRDALGFAQNDASIDSVVEYYRERIKNALGDYGNVIRFNNEGVTIEVSISEMANNMGYGTEELDQFYEECDDDLHCVYHNLIGEYYDKPEMRIDNRFTPDVNEDYFNEILTDRLSEIRI